MNPKDQPDGFIVNGTLPVSDDQGVHSLTDVSVFASGPGAERFRGTYNNIDIFFKMADALGQIPFTAAHARRRSGEATGIDQDCERRQVVYFTHYRFLMRTKGCLLALLSTAISPPKLRAQLP